MPEPGTPGMREFMDKLITYPDARMLNDRLLDLVKYTAADGGQSAEQVGQFQKTRHNVYWDHSRRRFVALPYFPENPQDFTVKEVVVMGGGHFERGGPHLAEA
eukprot:1809087-Pleurochrysis_carterae.AAC.1